MNRYVLFALVTLSISAFAGPMWHCTANNKAGAVWNEYGQTQGNTRYIVEKECIPNNGDKECPVICFPPKIYWRCLSHDTVPATNPSKNAAAPQQGTWYWASSAKEVAINGARDACRHNSSYGGCYVNPKECASS
jgi:hypothetical protein